MQPSRHTKFEKDKYMFHSNYLRISALKAIFSDAILGSLRGL